MARAARPGGQASRPVRRAGVPESKLGDTKQVGCSRLDSPANARNSRGLSVNDAARISVRFRDSRPPIAGAVRARC